jgi:hypothetical protein
MASGVGDGGGTAMGGGGNRLAAAGRYESDDGGLRAYGPSSGPHMSEADDGYAASSSAGRPGPLQGLANDYFGPAAGSGPYSTTPPEHHPVWGGGMGPTRTSPDYLARGAAVRGDGVIPHGPDDIASAVEIGASGREGEEGEGGGDNLLGVWRDNNNNNNMNMRRQGSPPPVRDSIAGRFELYGTEVPAAAGAAREMGVGGDTHAPRPLGTPGSELSASELGTPSPLSHEERQRQQTQQQQQQQQGG